MSMQATSVTPLALSVKEAAQRLGVGPTLFGELLRAGDIIGVKVGRRTLIPESELQRFLREKLLRAASAAHAPRSPVGQS
jgi:excisionase family DNA binding protein